MEIPRGVGIVINLLEANNTTYQGLNTKSPETLAELFEQALYQGMMNAATSIAMAILYHDKTRPEDFLLVISNMGKINSPKLMQAAREILETRRKNG